MTTGTGYAVSLVLSGRRVLVVGAGRVAGRRFAGLLEAGADVVVVAPEAGPEIARRAAAGEIEWVPRGFEPADVDGAWLCVAATGVPAVDAAVVAAAGRARCFVADASDGGRSSARAMAVFRRGALEVAVGTGGRAPGVAAGLRDHLAAAVGPEYGTLVELVAELRPVARPGVDWSTVADTRSGSILDLIRAGRMDEARGGLRSCLSSLSG